MKQIVCVCGDVVTNRCVSVCLRLELSDSLMSTLHELQKALGEPNAFSQPGAVSVPELNVTMVNLQMSPRASDLKKHNKQKL